MGGCGEACHDGAGDHVEGGRAGRYYTEHLPSYYLNGDEPPGRWWGRGADRLGLQGVVDSDAFLAVMAHDPATGRDLGRRYGEGSVRGYDATFSAPKSVSVLLGIGDEQVRDQVVEAHERAVGSVLGWIESHAHTRLRHHGHIMCVDAEGIVVGVFRQHTSRRLDPQLHTHAVIANRVRSPDGRWLALDARTIKLDQRTLSALYHANLRSELTRRLGVRWQSPEHGIAEIADLDPVVLAEFSQRTNNVQRRLDEKLGRFRTDLEREPTDQERWRLEREAAGESLRSIAVRLGRSASTVSREVARNGGRSNYRAHRADRAAWERACRPKSCKLAANLELRVAVEEKLALWWSPQQISGWLKEAYPDTPEMWVSHETIYLTLFVQGRGGLKHELTQCLRTHRAIRRPTKKRTPTGKGQIREPVMISERPAEADDRAVPGHWQSQCCCQAA